MADKSNSMSFNYLGCSGLKVSNICLGGLTFGIDPEWDAPSQLTEEQSHVLLDRFAELGGNFIDTADAYSGGRSEQIVGSWLSKQQRDKYIVATKVLFPVGDGCNDSGLSRKHIMDQVDRSLKRLQTDYIDLYQTHLWDNGTPIEETLRTLDDLVRAGKVRYVGASNVTGWQLQLIMERSRQMGLNKWISLQQQYNLLCRESEFEVLDVCRSESLAVLPWSPLKGGLLSGKFKRNEKIDTDTRIGWVQSKGITEHVECHPAWSKYSDSERYWNLIEKMIGIGKLHDKSVAQVAIRWLLQKDNVSSVIVGATKLGQLENNIAAGSGWALTDDQMNDLDEASAYEVPYPYEMIWRSNKERLRPNQPH